MSTPDKTMTINPGTCVMIPKGQFCQPENSGDSPMALLATRAAPPHTSYVNPDPTKCVRYVQSGPDVSTPLVAGP